MLGCYELAARTLCLSEQDGISRTTRRAIAVMDHDLVILCIDRLLDEWFLYALATNHDTIVILLNIILDVLKE